MATTYRQQQPTLQDLLLGQGSAPQAPVAPGQSQESGGDSTSQLLALLSAPEDQGPAPTVDEPSTWDKIRMTIGDSLGSALQAWGAVAGGGSPPPLANSYGKFVARQDQQRNDLAAWQKRTADAKREAKLRGVDFIERKQARDLAKLEQAAALADTRAYTEKVVKEAAGVQAARDAAKDAADLQRTREDNATRLQVERLQERQRVANEGDKGKQKMLDEQHSLYVTSKQQAMGQKGKWIQDLKNGRDPASIREEWSDWLKAGDLLPEYMDASQAFFDANIEPILEKADEQKFIQNYQNQGPAQGATQAQTDAARAATRRTARY